MEQLRKFADKTLSMSSTSIKRIGGGYYADVYKLDYENTQPLIVKVYKSENVMQDEIAQLNILKKHSLYTMPEVIFSHIADSEYGKDFIIMNYLRGENAGNIFYLRASKRKALADSIIDNLIAFHSVHNPDGFGMVNSDSLCSTFNEYYKNKVNIISEMASVLYKNKQLTDYVYGVIKEAVINFDKIFYLPITEASLVHGDYNTWNILADKKRCEVTAIIDPCGCMWADREYDLYQLNNANGKHLNLFENYASKMCLSENCCQKMAFYELFTEVEHYYKSGYPVVQKLIKRQAQQLKNHLDK